MGETLSMFQYGKVALYDLEPKGESLCEDVSKGMRATPKRIPTKYLYDEKGAHLFEKIMQQEDYYLTRTEIAILMENRDEIVQKIGERSRLIEFGSGSGVKTHLLLERMKRGGHYVPIDISRTQLIEFALSAAEQYPHLEVTPMCADFTKEIELPEGMSGQRSVAFFPGASFGNFEAPEGSEFLVRVREMVGTGGGFLIGVDLWKEPGLIESAYNDPAGAAADFNLNLLRRLNRECGCNFQLGEYRHRAAVDEQQKRVEMRIESLQEQEVSIPGSSRESMTITLLEGEPIVTSYACKFTPEEFEQLAESAGWQVERKWTDPKRWFAVYLLRST